MAATFAAPAVTITPAAERFARRMVRCAGLPAGAGMVLRVSPGGCSGYSTSFDVAAAPAPAEAVIEAAGADGAALRIFVDAASAEILDGATLDFVESATAAGLKVTTPAGSGCGCSAAAAPAVTAVPLSAISRRPRA